MAKSVKLVLVVIVAFLGMSALDFCLHSFNYPWFPGQGLGALVLALVVVLLMGTAIARIVTFGKENKEEKESEREEEK